MFISGAPRRRCGAIPLYHIRLLYRIFLLYIRVWTFAHRDTYFFGVLERKSNIVCRISRASTSMILRSKHLRTRYCNRSRVFSLLREYRNTCDLSSDWTIIRQRRHRKGIMIGEAPLGIEASDLVCDAFYNIYIYKCVRISLHTCTHGLSLWYIFRTSSPPTANGPLPRGFVIRKLMKKNCLNRDSGAQREASNECVHIYNPVRTHLRR
uniref:Uncharacterized protein n=1 Tax=Trichogramma kaykai TaxID=54128 RepID=A0ABD2X8F4_9HYME